MYRGCRWRGGTGFLKTCEVVERALFRQADIDIEDAPGDGLFTEGCLALVEGEYTEEATLEIIAIGQPPCEPRSTARSVYYITKVSYGIDSVVDQYTATSIS